MRTNKNFGIAIAIIGLGVILLLSKFGILGGLMGYIIPILMIALGYYGIKQGNKFFGWIILIIGTIALVSKMAWIFGILLAIGLIVFGISMLSDRRKSYR
ncbi:MULTISPECIES: hypothetical protein [unclassified Paenibacillus]|uniref:LiaF transmembrane domain-containing protein n=1 Tax=unclassified Paenibacillus TaxID=185978 RepID=UPI001C11A8F7|nr:MULTISPECIES: hypothetical protein [unclassified Paenibacillus]MBU5441365.1 hypothetical protein [Paenibacillus sp. MSJ-34]CAH0118230.1 hypothetical protein PAE9249_00714 [Paenibacillus sp. CECT 9249]